MEYTRESIFISAIRYLCNAFFSVVGIILALILLLAGVGLMIGPKVATNYKAEALIVPDENGKDALLPHTDPAILKINIEGPIGTLKLNTQVVEKALRESRKGMLKGNRVKGVLLYINSPGGTITDSNGIYNAIKRYKQQYKVPVYAYVEGLCASGGMYIGCSADRINSSSVAIVGSVGVITGPFFNFKDLMTKYGVNALTITSGKGKDSLNPFRKWKDDEDSSIQNIVDYQYQNFVNIVVSNRPKMSKNALVNEYGAQIFNPVKAKEYGYIDEDNSSYSQTLKELREHAQISDDQSYQVVEMQVRPSIFTELFNSKAKLFFNFEQDLMNPLKLLNPQEKFLYYCDV